MSSSPDPGTPYRGRPSDETAQFPAVPPPVPAGGNDATMPGMAGSGIPPVGDQTTRMPQVNPPAHPPPSPRPPSPHPPSPHAPPAGAPSPHPLSAPPPSPHPPSPHPPSAAAPSPHPPPGWTPLGPGPGNGGADGGIPPGSSPGGFPPYGELDGTPVPGKPPRKWLKPAIAAGAALALLLVFTGGTMAFAGEVPRGTTVLGVDIGGRSRAEAAKALQAGLAKRVTEPVTVKIGDAESKIDPKDVELAVDYSATTAAAAQRWPNPITVLFGEREVEPVVKVDAKKLDALLQKAAASATEKLTRPAIRYEGLTPEPIYPGAGRGLDLEESAKALRRGWLRGGAVAIPIVPIHSVTSKEDVDRLVAELAEPAVAAPVTVTTPDGDITIPPEAIAKSLIMESDEKGEIIPRIDAKKLHAAAKRKFGEVEAPAKDAKPSVQGGKVVVSAETPGQKVDLKKLTAAMLPVLQKSAPREVAGSLVESKPKITRESIGKLGIKEKVSSFTTHFKGGQDRNKNILVVADEVDNALVMPGKTFSLNGYTGERSYAQGYVDAPVIINGKIKNYVGGGISQFATTLFNAYYYGGFEDVYHRPHGYYISRYPSVVEATVFYPSLDLKFKNDSKHGVLIDTSYSDTSITVSMWGTKRYDIETVWGEKYDHTKPKTVHLKEKDCIPTEGIPGFAQEAWRIFQQNGEEIKRQRFFWRYKAEPKFVCDDPDESSSSDNG